MGKAVTLLIVCLRAVMAWRFVVYGDMASVILALSEAWALVATCAGLVWSIPDRRRVAAITPLLYCSPLLLSPVHSADTFFLSGLLACMLIQAGVRLYMGLSLNVGIPVYRRLLDRGPYRFIRHPLASTEIGIVVCYVLHCLHPWNIVWGTVCLSCIYLAVRLEEGHLRRFAPYRGYMRRVPYRFIAGVI